MTENIINNPDKSEGLGSKANILNSGFYENSLLPSNELLKKKSNNEKIQEFLDENMKKVSSKNFKTENVSQNNNSISSSKRNKKANKEENDSYLANDLLLNFDENKFRKRRSKPIKLNKGKEKRYIVDNIDNILSKLNKSKIKLIIQEILLYSIVFIVLVYYWIFLFISRNKIERNYCFSSLYQFDSCSTKQICSEYNRKLNIILFNDTFQINNSTLIPHDSFVEENRIINIYYKPFFLRFHHILSTNGLFNTIQTNSNNNVQTNFVVVLTIKEKWNLFYRNFSLCEFDNYYIIFVIMIATGGIFGSILFGIISDIYGRRSVIRVTLFIITLTTILFVILSTLYDYYYIKFISEYNKNNKIVGPDPSFSNIIPQLYSQEKIRLQFRKDFNWFALSTFIISAGLWPLLKSCMALLIENSAGELQVLIAFRRYNFFFGGLPPLFTSLIFVNLNDFTKTFIILGSLDLILFIFSFIFLDESMRYYYEYCEWPKLTEVIFNTYNVEINDFTTLNDEELREFRKEENLKNFNHNIRRNNFYKKNENDSSYIFRNSYLNDLKEKNLALSRNIKRDTDFVIKLEDVKSNPLIIFICLTTNRSLITSKYLILIVLIILYILMNLLEKQMLESPFFSIEDLYLDCNNNYIINSVFFFFPIINIASNFFFYAFYRINCFKTIIIVSLIYIEIALLIYHLLTSKEEDTPLDLNEFNFSMLEIYYREKIPKTYIIIIYTTYFFLNGANFYVYLLIFNFENI